MSIKIVAKNKKASFDFQLIKKYEAGLVLQGTEVKGLRAGQVNIKESYIQIDNDGEAWILNMNIPHYEFGNINNHQETRRRKLLLHKKEIAEIAHKQKTDSLTIVPTIVYFKNGRIKLEIALAKGKKAHDKRQDKAKKDVERKLKQKNYDNV